MNTIRITMMAAATLCVAGIATAAEPVQPSRADVIAELHAARAAGTLGIHHGEDGGSFHQSQQPWTSALGRADVAAEMLAARQSGESAALHGEDGGAFLVSQRPASSLLTRDEVVAEMHAARDSGEMAALHGEDGGSFLLARNGWQPHLAFARRTAVRHLAAIDDADASP